MSEDNPGIIFLKQFSDSEESSFYALKDGITIPDLNSLPEEISPAGLDIKRQWYLYEQIRPFRHSTLYADLTCPKPSSPKPSTESDSSLTPSAPKRIRLCGQCRQPGHTKKNMPKIIQIISSYLYYIV